MSYDISKTIKIHNYFESQGEKWVCIKVDRGYLKPATDLISYAKYLMILHLNRWLEPWEYVYHINRKWKDDRLENFKIINIKHKDIEVKYPYDPEKYRATINWDKKHRCYKIILYLKQKYKNDKSLNIRMQRPIQNYIYETEILKRFLNHDERVIFKDKNFTNYNKNNLKIIKKFERGYSKYPIGEIPYQNYYIGNEYSNNNNIYIRIFHVRDKSKDTIISRAKYRYCLKLGRLLERNEYIIYKDGNHLNDNLDNLTHKTYPQAEYPFEDYLEGNIYKQNKRKKLILIHQTDPKLNLTMNYARYRKQVIEGRIFSKNEEVDHIDTNPQNDSDNNLQILIDKKHNIKSSQEHKEKVPNVQCICHQCYKKFILSISSLLTRLKYSKYNNIFCSQECKGMYRHIHRGIYKKVKLIEYVCVGTGKKFYIPKDAKILPSRFNPDALPFSSFRAISKWLKLNL